MSENTTSKTGNVLPSTRRSLPISLIRARESVMTPIRAMLHEFGLTEQQWRVLRVLDELGPIDATRLADRAGLLAPSVTRIVQTMTEKEYISRSADPEDRRRQVIALSPRGQAIINENLEEALRITNSFQNALGISDYELLLDLLDRLIDAKTDNIK